MRLCLCSRLCAAVLRLRHLHSHGLRAQTGVVLSRRLRRTRAWAWAGANARSSAPCCVLGVGGTSLAWCSDWWRAWPSDGVERGRWRDGAVHEDLLEFLGGKGGVG